MTPALLLQFFAILAGGACFIAFLAIILFVVYMISAKVFGYEYIEEENEEEMISITPDIKLTKREFEVYSHGVGVGSSIVFVSLFKCWKDNNEVPIVGDFDTIRIDMVKNLEVFNKDKKLMNDWVDMYNQFFKKIEEDK